MGRRRILPVFGRSAARYLARLHGILPGMIAFAVGGSAYLAASPHWNRTPAPNLLAFQERLVLGK